MLMNINKRRAKNVPSSFIDKHFPIERKGR